MRYNMEAAKQLGNEVAKKETHKSYHCAIYCKRAAKIRSTFFSHLVLILVSLISIFPFIWLISTSLKGNSENIFAYPPQIIPQDFTWANYTGVWDKVNFIGYFINSMIVAGGTVVLNLILSAMAGYPLARMEF